MSDVTPLTPEVWTESFTRTCAELQDGPEAQAVVRLAELVNAAPRYGIERRQAAQEARAFRRRAFPWRPEGWLDPVDVLRSRPPTGERIATGLPTLDAATRGGFPVGRVVIFSAAPGSGKTTLALQIVARAVIEGRATVAALMPDGGADAAVLRLAQQLGIGEDELVTADEDALTVALERLSGFLRNGGFLFPPEDPDSMLIESVAAELAGAPSDLPRVLFVDSIQTAFTGTARDQANDRERVQAVMRRLHHVSREVPCLVLGVSQTNRASYRARKEEENSSPLSAGADSRAIEFDSDALYFLRGDPGEGAVQFRSTPKNRIGKPVKIDLRLDPETAIFSEVDAVAAEDARADRETRLREANSSRAQAAILSAIERCSPPKGHPGLSLNLLAQKARLNKGRTAFLDAIDALENQKAIEAVDGPRGGTYYRRRAS